MATLHRILTGHTNQVNFVEFSPDGQLLASTGNDFTVRLWNMPNGDLNNNLVGHTSWVAKVTFSPDGKSLLTGGGDKTIRTWSVATKKQLKILNGHSGAVWSIAWSPNGDMIASGSDDKTVILWDAISGSVKRTLAGHTNTIWCVSFSKNGNKLASTGFEDNTAMIWDVNSGAALFKLAHHNSVYGTCFSPDDRFVVTTCRDMVVRMFNANNGREEKRFKGHTDWINSAAFSFDGSMLASAAGDNTVRLWDVASAKQVQQLDGHTDWVISVAFSRDGRFIASTGKDLTIRLWNAPPWLPRQILPPPALKRFCAARYDFAGTEKGQVGFQQNSILSIDGPEQGGWVQAKLLPNGPSGFIPINYVEIISETEAQRRLQLAQQQKTAELEKQKQQQREVELQKAKLEKQKEEETKKAKVNSDTSQVADWSVDDVCSYLKQAKIDDNVVVIFRQQKIKGKNIAHFANDGVLQSIGITAIGDRLDVVSAINKLSSSSTSPVNTGLKVHEIPRRELTKDTKLSEGNFGIVWRGTYTGIPVAIKEPKLYGAELNPKKQLADLIEEATVMTGISNNPNVLHCYGISRVGEDDYLLVTELCNLGSLDAFLRSHPLISAVDRRRFSQQVARGLKHLGKHNIAHRDIAARNVLLHDQGDGLIVAKVCDFGLSRQRQGEYYVITGEHLVSPETAPEVFSTGKHSSRSDVWSFGVLLWEVESLCASRARPDTQAFPPLSKPAQADDNIYQIMLKCWAKDPYQRPSFEALIDMLA